MINLFGGLAINQDVNNDTLPVHGTVAGSLFYDAGVINWFQADQRFVTTSENDDIVSFNDVKGTINKLLRSSSSASATLVEELFNGFPGARFNASEQDRSLFSGNALATTQKFTWAGVATLRTLSASCTLLGTFTSASIRAILNVSISGGNAGKLAFLFGTASCFGPTLELDEPFAFACGYDGTNIFLRVNGQLFTTVAAGSPSTSVFSLGALPGGSQFWDGDVAEVFICNVPLNTSAGSELLAKISNYFSKVYRLTL
ncbi:hypothetical protein [Escherichia coli]|uniref:hypothetical protein n=1 Tax=Escherichia coli TaxID=562 RepID=UPI002A35CFBC|nr:hypothetical protein [Escherichia coli]